MFEFGSGTLWITPVSGNEPANPTPIQVGTLQDVSLDIAFDLKMLYGMNQFPESVARGKGKITGKAKFGRFNSDLINQIMFAQTRTVGTKVAQRDEDHTMFGAGAILTYTVGAGGSGYAVGDTGTISGGTLGTYRVTAVSGGTAVTAFVVTDPGIGYTVAVEATVHTSGSGNDAFTVSVLTVSSGANTITVNNVGTYVLDLGVRYGATGVPLLLVPGVPATGEYSHAGGVYTFNAGDSGADLRISYLNTVAATGVTQNITNQLMGTEPICTFVFRTIFNNQEMVIIFYAGVVGKLALASKLDDYTIPECDFECFADASGKVMDIYAAE